MAVRIRQGFTLIEMIVAIVIIAIAMVSLTSFLFPLVQDSARPHYEVRAAALGQSLLTAVISRGYDENSDPDGGIIRCGEGSDSCTVQSGFGPDGVGEIEDGVRKPQNFNDVDDYIGCWTTNSASEAHCSDIAGNLNDIFGNNISSEYPNFSANISVIYDTIAGNSQFKKVSVVITAGQYGQYTFSAYRGNY